MPCFFKKVGWQSLLHGKMNHNLPWCDLYSFIAPPLTSSVVCFAVSWRRDHAICRNKLAMMHSRLPQDRNNIGTTFEKMLQIKSPIYDVMIGGANY